MRTHAEYSPSRLTYLEKCPGWIGGGGSSAAAERGTKIGERLAAYVIDGTDPTEGAPEDWADALAAGAEMLDSIMAMHPDMTWSAEDHLDTGIDGCSGWADLVGRDHLIGEVVLIELKTGRGSRPEAAENPQVHAYGLGLCRAESVSSARCYLVECDRHWVSTADISADDASATVNAIIGRAKSAGDADLAPGQHCGYCQRIEQCPAVASAPQQALATIGERTLTPADYAAALAPADLGALLTKIEPLAAIVEKYAGALKSRAIACIEAGADVPGWSVKRTAGARSWMNETAALDAIRAAFPDEHAACMDLCSPAQAEKRLGKTAKSVVSDHTKTSGRVSLVKAP